MLNKIKCVIRVLMSKLGLKKKCEVVSLEKCLLCPSKKKSAKKRNKTKK